MLKQSIQGLALIAALLCGAPAHAQWRVAQSDHFMVYADMHDGDLRNTVEQLERFHDLLARQFGTAQSQDVRKLPVYIVQSRNELETLNPGLRGRNTAGYYSATPMDVYAAYRRGQGEHTMQHEYAHHFFFQNAPAKHPLWFIEGFAEFFGPTDLSNPQKVKVGYYTPMRLAALQRSQRLPLEAILTAQRYPASDAQKTAFYGQAWELTHYLFSDPARRQSLDGYLIDTRNGMPVAQAVQTHFGMTIEELDQAVRRYGRGRMPYAELEMQTRAPQIQITRLPSSAPQLLLSAKSHTYNKSPAEVRELMPRVRAARAQYPDDRLALVSAGRAELRWGDMDTAKQSLERVLATAPADAEALRLMAEWHIKTATPLEGEQKLEQLHHANGYLRRALDADPTDYRIYMTLAQVRSISPSYPTENDINTLAMALSYAPQVQHTRVRLAQALRAAGQGAQADAILAVVDTTTH